jgi:surface antigen
LRYADPFTVKRRLLVVLALLAALMSPLLASPASAAGNDYPYRGDAQNRADKWGFTTRQCVSFAAWRLEQGKHAISNRGNTWGDAQKWDDTARARHIPVSARPKVGSIAQWNAGERSAYYASNGARGYVTAGGYGHVAYVAKVYSDGSVLIEQYNMTGNRSYSTMRVKAPRYLYLGG